MRSFIILALCLATAFAANHKHGHGPFKVCHDDKKQYCGGFHHNFNGLRQCLREHLSSLSQPCQDIVLGSEKLHLDCSAELGRCDTGKHHCPHHCLTEQKKNGQLSEGCSGSLTDFDNHFVSKKGALATVSAAGEKNTPHKEEGLVEIADNVLGIIEEFKNGVQEVENMFDLFSSDEESEKDQHVHMCKEDREQLCVGKGHNDVHGCLLEKFDSVKALECRRVVRERQILKSVCAKDMKDFCLEKKGRKALRCLHHHRATLSAFCGQRFDQFVMQHLGKRRERKHKEHHQEHPGKHHQEHPGKHHQEHHGEHHKNFHGRHRGRHRGRQHHGRQHHGRQHHGRQHHGRQHHGRQHHGRQHHGRKHHEHGDDNDNNDNDDNDEEREKRTVEGWNWQAHAGNWQGNAANFQGHVAGWQSHAGKNLQDHAGKNLQGHIRQKAAHKDCPFEVCKADRTKFCSQTGNNHNFFQLRTCMHKNLESFTKPCKDLLLKFRQQHQNGQHNLKNFNHLHDGHSHNKKDGEHNYYVFHPSNKQLPNDGHEHHEMQWHGHDGKGHDGKGHDGKGHDGKGHNKPGHGNEHYYKQWHAKEQQHHHEQKAVEIIHDAAAPTHHISDEKFFGKACRNDRARYCPKANTETALNACRFNNWRHFSKECKESLVEDEHNDLKELIFLVPIMWVIFIEFLSAFYTRRIQANYFASLEQTLDIDSDTA